jgi:hypothetical protein
LENSGFTASAPLAVSNHRSASIKFLGKNGWEALRNGHDKSINAPSAQKEASIITSSKPKQHAATTIMDNTILKNPMYGRPQFTEAEIEALLTGGATMAPKVLSHSTGAKFKI